MRDVLDVVGPLVAFVAVLALAIGYGGALTDAMTPEPGPMYDPTPPPCLDYWIVGPGETLWGIARRCYPGAHTGQMVAAIREANPDVDPGRMRVGQTLRLPTSVETVGGDKRD